MAPKRAAERIITKVELAKHVREDDLWVGVAGVVYDMTNFIHPGGRDKILAQGGKDATAVFVGQHDDNRLSVRGVPRVGLLAGAPAYPFKVRRSPRLIEAKTKADAAPKPAAAKPTGVKKTKAPARPKAAPRAKALAKPKAAPKANVAPKPKAAPKKAAPKPKAAPNKAPAKPKAAPKATPNLARARTRSQSVEPQAAKAKKAAPKKSGKGAIAAKKAPAKPKGRPAGVMKKATPKKKVTPKKAAPKATPNLARARTRSQSVEPQAAKAKKASPRKA